MGLEYIKYGEFSEGISTSISGQGRYPSNVSMEITHRCPLTCAHCYNNLPMGDVNVRNSELTYEEYCRILDELAEAGTLWLHFTGGEVFARKDFLDIYIYAKQKGFLINIFTNATLITPEIADQLAQWRPFRIEITLYGCTKQTYERLTGVAGSYEKCLRGIRLLLERDLPVALKTVAVTINKHEVYQMKQFVRDEFGLEFKFDAMMNARIDCSQSPLAVRLLPEEVVELDLYDPAVVADWRHFAKRYSGPVHTGTGNEGIYHCGGAINNCAIDPQGRLSLCIISQLDTYDLRKGTFKEGWEVFLKKVRSKPRTMETKCVNCGIKAMCGMCPANGELENGHAEKPIDFLCEVAHLRAQLFDVEVSAHGDCEYCMGSSKHNTLLESVSRLRKRLESGEGKNFEKDFSRALPILNETKLSFGGCGSCG